MGNIQTNDKPIKAGKSPAKGKHFIRNLNRKSSGRESKKYGRKKSDAKRDAIDRQIDNTPDTDNNEAIAPSDTDTVECVLKTLPRVGTGGEYSSVQSEVTVTRCESRSLTCDQPPADDSTSESVFTDPLTPLAVELNQCYYSAESDSAHDEPARTLTPSQVTAPHACSPISLTIEMPHDDAASSLSDDNDTRKEEKVDAFDDNSDKGDNEKVMGSILSGFRGDHLERSSHECSHDLLDNRLKACPGQTSFTVSKHRKVELPPVACEPSLSLLDHAVIEKDRRPASVSEVPPPMTESNVLRKVASLTLDKHTEPKVLRPKFVPDKLDFRLYEKFEAKIRLISDYCAYVTISALANTLQTMQLSTNRVNFTNASVAQFNYVKFVNKFRTTQKNIQDIVTILGLHNDNVSSNGEGENLTKTLWQRSLSSDLKKKRALMLYVPPKKLIINMEKSLQWFKCVILALSHGDIEIQIECDLRMAVIRTRLYQHDMEAEFFYVLRISNINMVEWQMLLNWFISSISDNNHLKSLLNLHDLRNLGIQYCTHLLAAGVLRQISDKDAPSENIFKPNLMYYWAHMEAPASQPVTPGRLHVSAWPPDKEASHFFTQDNLTNRCNIEINKYLNQNNNEEISDVGEAKVIISQLKIKLQELEYQLEKYKINTQIDSLNKNFEKGFDAITEYNIIKNRVELLSKEVQTSNIASELNKITNKPVITIPEYDSLRTNVNIDNALDLSSLEDKNVMAIKDVTTKPDIRSEKIENYCKLNKSRDCNKTFRNENMTEGKDVDNVVWIEKKAIEPVNSAATIDHTVKIDDINASGLCDSSSDASFVSTCASSDLVKSQEGSSIDMITNDDVDMKNMIRGTDIPTMQVLYASIKHDQNLIFKTSQSLLENSNNILLDQEKVLNDKKEFESNQRLSLPENLSVPFPDDTSPIKDTRNSKLLSANAVQTLPVEIAPGEPAPPEQNDEYKLNQPLALLPPPLPGMPPPPPPMPGTTSPSHMSPLNQIPETPTPLSTVSENASPPTLMPSMIPPPPPMPGICLLQTSFLETVPPPLPLPGMGTSEFPMPGIGPPPPPMPGMGPPPPPMPGMGPPPPPMPGTCPPPPPMLGMGPPPPPMPGIGPPPPPMPGMGPPPPPLPGMGPPPPPLPGMGPPPPSMAGIMSCMSNADPPPPPGMPGLGPGPPPPPANLGPLPFPAPPVGGWNMQRATLRKTPVKPAAPMKPLYWTRILAAPTPPSQGEPDSTLKPLWLEIEETKLDNIDEFTDLFSRQVVKAPVKKKVEVKTKIQPVKILDSKRSQNVGILAQSLHVEFSEIENSIYNFDTSVVSLEALQQIYELRANEEELSMIKQHMKSKPDIPLDRPEAFLHDLSGIPNFAERISCFMFQAEFEDAISTTMHKLDNLKHTCEFLMTSESLKKLFAIILTLGNYMNGGNGQRGQADGFGLEILSKLKDVKSKQSNVTLLHFIVRTYMRVAESGGGGGALPVPEPGDVARAAAIDFADVAAGLAALREQLDACKEKTKKVVESDVHPRNLAEKPSAGEGKRNLEVFKDKMTTFLNAAEDKLKTETENLEECRTTFMATVKFYQYSSKCGKLEDCEPKEFFSLWTAFCSDFKDIYKKEEQIAIKEKLKEAKKLQEERKSLTQPIKEGGLKARLQKLSSSRK